MKKLLVAGIVLTAVMGTADAGDMPLKAPVAVVTEHDWTGFYVGEHVGVGQANLNNSFADPGNAGFVACGACAGPWASQTPSAKDRSWLGGGHFGYNWQVTPLWLAGVEGDFTWSGIRTSSTTALAQPAPGPGLTTFPSTLSFQTDIKWLASARGRIGLTRDSWLAYFTGGVAWGDINFRASAVCPVVAGFCGGAGTGEQAAFSERAIKTGFVLGGGTEWQAPSSPWRARVEYLYYQFGGANASSTWLSSTTGAPVPCGGVLGTCGAAFDSGDIKIHTVRFGLSYAFD